MTELLLKIFVKDYKNVSDPKIRLNYGVFSGFAGIAVNVLLSALKFVLGSLTGSIAVTADAFNNLSDVGSSIVNVIGFKVASKPADEKHPFGYGRIEYISALIVSFLIMLMGFELGKSSIEKIISPQPVIFSYVTLAALIASIAVKLCLGLFNRNLGKRIGSAALLAVMKDSFADALSTAAAIISLLVSHFFKINIDGYVGFAVACFVFWAGISVLRDSMAPLLGEAADSGRIEEMENVILGFDEIILGIHDFILHDYGPGKSFATAHVEVPSSCDIVYAHNIIDEIEVTIGEKFGTEMVLHIDPVNVDDKSANDLYSRVSELVKEVDEHYTVHDFRVVDGGSHIKLIFDMIIDEDSKKNTAEINRIVREKIKNEIGAEYVAVIKCEYSYVKKK